ncbi:type II toxin-antitoxin system HicA family toxin [Alicyclobacillus curvatus]|nr:type II toxin-antitoxin system HicA family toxin [Alicyclobacillus curvatus]
MSQWEKLLQSIRNNPNSVRFDELDKVLRNTGFERKQSGKGSSHYRYVLGTDQIVVPRHGNYVKEVYVKQVIEILSQKGWI